MRLRLVDGQTEETQSCHHNSKTSACCLAYPCRCGGIGSGWVSKLYGSDTAPVLVDRQSGAPAQVVEVHYSAYQIAPAGYDGTNFGLGQFGGTLQRALQLSALSAPSSLDW